MTKQRFWLLACVLATLIAGVAQAGIEDYSTTPGSNTSLFPEGMNPGTVNDSARQVQADVRTYYETPQWRDLGYTPVFSDSDTFTITGDVTAYFTADQRVKIFGNGAMGTVYGSIASATYSAPNTTINVSLDSGSLDSTIAIIYAGLDPRNDPIPAAAIKGNTSVPSDFITSLTAVTALEDADQIPFADSSDSNGNKKITVANAKLTFQPPAGSVFFFAGASAPTDYILSYGQAISRTTYANLFSAIGTTYGVGDGSTTFNVPDCRGRVIAGQDDMGGSSANRLTDAVSQSLNGDTLGDTGGEETHTLIVSEIPAHTHTIGEHNNSGGSNLDPAIVQVGQSSPATIGTGATSSTGGDGAHNNVQPTIILNCIIKI